MFRIVMSVICLRSVRVKVKTVKCTSCEDPAVHMIDLDLFFWLGPFHGAMRSPLSRVVVLVVVVVDIDAQSACDSGGVRQ